MANGYIGLSHTLKKLLFERNMRASDLAKEVNLPKPTIGRIINGESAKPKDSTIQPIADYFQISIKQLIGEEPLPGSNYDIFKLDKNAKIIAILQWNDLVSGHNNSERKSFLTVSGVSDSAFALINPDYSMEPLIQKDSILIFDPDREPQDGSFVLVKIASIDSSIYVFRKLFIDLNQRFIKALNPELGTGNRMLQANDEIVATLVESRKCYD